LATAPIARAAAKGALYVGAAQGVRGLLMIGMTIVAARILSPDDYGVLAMWAPILAFVLLFQELGFSTSTIQAESLTTEQSTTLFWINVGASSIIALLLIITSPLIGTFYGDDRVAYVTAASAGMVLVASLGIQHTALLNREMRYRQIAAIVVSSATITAATTVGLAAYLQNYWSLYLGMFAGTITQVVMTWAISNWRPGRRAPLQDTKPLIELGLHVASFGILNFFSRNVDNVLIGRFWGAMSLGLYERSQQLMVAPLQLVNWPLGRVMLPVLSRLRDEERRYKEAYISCLRALLLATAPPAAVAIAASDVLVVLLLGSQWEAASPIFFWLALGTLYQPIANSTGWLFISRGRGRAFAVWGVVSSTMTVASFVIGLPGGPASVARAYVAMNFLLTLTVIVWASKGSPVRARDIYYAAAPAMAAAGMMILVARQLHEHLNPLNLVLVCLPVSYLLAIGTLWFWPGGRDFLRQLFRLLRATIMHKSDGGNWLENEA
jgi:polysaccharide transporter, PST family